MRKEPQVALYRPDTPITALAGWIGDPVTPAHFPQPRLRWRNQRWAAMVGLDRLCDDDWLRHFAGFVPLDANLLQPLALRYHGHQFHHYNPDLGDGRGFLFAQLRDAGVKVGGGASGRLLDLGTKGSGKTPYSRDGDGRLTLKGAVREILATEMLEALGVDTSKSFSVVETCEKLWRSDEPSPTRAAVLVRLSHGHIRIGSFQRLLALNARDHMAELVDYCLAQFPGPQPPEGAPGHDQPAVVLLHQVVARLADLAASYVTAGFVHGVLNSDNMNISGESFDYGPWRFLPRWESGFTAAYFDHEGLYSFGRQAEAIHWNCGQLAVSLRMLVPGPPLIAALNRFEPLFEASLARRLRWRLGYEDTDADKAMHGDHGADAAFISNTTKALAASGEVPDRWFFSHRLPSARNHDMWRADAPPSLVIDEVERVWSAIAEQDDWALLDDMVKKIRMLGEALGSPPAPLGHEVLR